MFSVARGLPDSQLSRDFFSRSQRCCFGLIHRSAQNFQILRNPAGSFEPKGTCVRCTPLKESTCRKARLLTHAPLFSQARFLLRSLSCSDSLEMSSPLGSYMEYSFSIDLPGLVARLVGLAT